MQKEENISGLPEGWEEVFLKDISNVKVGFVGTVSKNLSTEKDGIPMITTKNIINGKIKLFNIYYVDKNFHEKNKKSALKKGDIIVARHGDTDNGKSAMMKFDFELNCMNVIVVKPNSKRIDPVFLLHFMGSKNYLTQVQGLAGGSVQKVINTRQLENIIIPYPPLPTQKSIAKILSSFDDKIELLQEQNETLEKMGQEIFREWFMLDKNIKKQRLGDLVTVKRGGSPRPIKDYISETGYNWLKISDATATKGPFVFNIKECIKKEGLSKTTHLKKGKLVLSNSATPGMPKILNVDSCIHDGWLHFPESKFSNEFLYLLFIEIRPQLIQQGSGSVFTNLKTDILKNFEAPLPEKSVLDDFDILIKPIFEKIKINSEEIESLSYIRDLLLTKLMKGEVLVGDLEN